MNSGRVATLKDRLIAGVISIRFPIRGDGRGRLVAFDDMQGLPFRLKRVFYVFDVPNSVERAGHASTAESVFVAIHGSLELEFDNGRERSSAQLADPADGFHVAAGIYIRARRFSADAVFLVLSSLTYSEVSYTSEPFFHGRNGHMEAG